MEAIKNFKIGGENHTLWQGRNAEGRRMYAVTSDWQGMIVQPNMLTHTSQRVCVEVARQNHAAMLDFKKNG